MASIEVKINTPEEQFLKSIDFNYDEIKGELQTVLEKYQNLAFTDETMKEAKNTRAHLNQLKTKIDNVRKDMKKRCLAPYEAFETKIKDLTNLVDKPILQIDSQVKSYEERCKQEKLENIKAFWNETAKDILPLVSFDRIFNEKWLNATTTMKSINEEITKIVDDIKQGLDTISQLHTEYELQVKDKFLETLSLVIALNENNRLKERQKAIEEQERLRKEAELKAQQQTQTSAPAETPKQMDIVEEVKKVEEQEYQIIFKVTANREKLSLLKQFLEDNHIKIERV